MRPPRRLRPFIAASLFLCALAAFGQIRGRMWGRSERIWARYEHEMQDVVDDPPDAGRKGELALGRLRYHSPMDGRGFYYRWGIDANKGDRLFSGLLHRLTRVDVEPIETIIDIDSDDIFDCPWLLAISAGDWQITPSQAARLRKYFDRGGFLLVDDFHNEREWAIFMAGINQIYPNANIIELPDDHPAFHVMYNLTKRIRVSGANVVHGSGIERGGVVPHWRGLLDSNGRMIIAINFNMDMGDGWEFADDPTYPADQSTEAIRLGISYAVYAMTH